MTDDAGCGPRGERECPLKLVADADAARRPGEDLAAWFFRWAAAARGWD